MDNDLLKEKPNYKMPVVETPYHLAEQEWDNRIGSARVQAKNWRLACLLSLLVCVILAAVTLIVITRSKEKVFIAQLGKQGQVVNVAPLRQVYQPQVAQYQYIIGKFISNTMQLSLDPVVVKRNWLAAYTFIAGKAKSQLDQLARQAALPQSIGKITKTIKIESIEQITPSSYAAKWQQKIIDRQGKILYTYDYSGVFTVTHQQPKTQQQILENPLGIKIIYFTLQREQ